MVTAIEVKNKAVREVLTTAGTIKEVADKHNVGTSTLSKWIRQAKVQSKKGDPAVIIPNGPLPKVAPKKDIALLEAHNSEMLDELSELEAIIQRLRDDKEVLRKAILLLAV